MGKQVEIGPPPSQDYDVEFPKLLKEALFRYFVDCAVPFTLPKQMQNENKCDLCQRFMIRPTTICACKMHKYCRKCIDLWQQLIDNPDMGTMKENHGPTAK